MRATRRIALEVMLSELEGNELLVCLAPSKRGENPWDMIRVACAKNAKWYREFCARHESTRQRARGLFDTRIKRRNTIRALRQLIEGLPAGKYGPELLRIARGFVTQLQASA